MHTLAQFAMWYFGIGLALYVLYELAVQPNFPSGQPWWVDSLCVVCAYPVIVAMIIVRAYRERRTR